MNYSTRNINTIITSILMGISVIVSIFFAHSFPKLPVISDSADYNAIATHILTDKTYITISNDEILYPPLYPIFLSIIYAFTHIDSFASVYSIQYLLVGLMAVFVFLILRTFSKIPLWLAILASMVTLFWPYFMLYSQLVSSEIIYSFLLLLFFYLFLHVRTDSKNNLIISAGILLGLALLARPVALLMLPWILIGLWVLQKMPKVVGQINVPWKKYLLILLVSTIVLVPWITYVKIKYNRIIPIASNLSFVFKKANSSFAYLPNTNPVKQNGRTFRYGEKYDHVSENKVITLLKAKAKNIYLFWDPGASGYHLDIIKQKYPLVGFTVLLYRLFFLVLLAFALLGAVILRKDTLVRMCVVLITYFWALHTVLFPFPRYTLPIIPYVVIVAVIAYSYGLTYIKTARIRRLAGKERSKGHQTDTSAN